MKVKPLATDVLRKEYNNEHLFYFRITKQTLVVPAELAHAYELILSSDNGVEVEDLFDKMTSSKFIDCDFERLLKIIHQLKSIRLIEIY